MLKVELRQYQKEAVDKCLKAFASGERGFLIGDKMGLGKTVEALAIIDKIHKRYNNVLVVAPTALLEKWKFEVKDKLSDDREYDILYASYNDLSSADKRLVYAKYNYDLIVFDEVHYAKNYRAKRTQGTLYSFRKISPPPIAEKADKLLGLSGTWPPNSVTECYTWLRAIKNPLAKYGFDSFASTFSEYCYRSPQGWVKYSGFKNQDLFRQNIANVFIARDISDVVLEIPEGLRIFEYLEPSKDLVKIEEELIEAISKLGYDIYDLINNPEYLETFLETFPDFSRIMHFRRLQGAAKISIIKEYIEENILPEISKFIVFCYFRDTADSYYRAFKDKIKTIKIDGQVPASDRFEILNQIKEEKECILVCTLDAVREGFDLIDFKLSIFSEIDWRPWVLEQAEGRTRRIGQNSIVRWIYFVFNSGIDRAIAKAIDAKKQIISEIKRI